LHPNEGITGRTQVALEDWEGYPSLGVRLWISEKNKDASLSHLSRMPHSEIHSIEGMCEHRATCTYNYLETDIKINFK
jgi:hypothetical protein